MARAGCQRGDGRWRLRAQLGALPEDPGDAGQVLVPVWSPPVSAAAPDAPSCRGGGFVGAMVCGDESSPRSAVRRGEHGGDGRWGSARELGAGGWVLACGSWVLGGVRGRCSPKHPGAFPAAQSLWSSRSPRRWGLGLGGSLGLELLVLLALGLAEEVVEMS